MQKITNGNVSVEISENGAELKSLKIGGREIMWCADPAYWGKTSPFLFPMVGNTKGDKTSIGGAVYQLGKHGFARDKTWEVADSDGSSVRLKLTSDEGTRKLYPFDFAVEITYKLQSGGVRIEYGVHSASDKPMPYCIGAHPAFACPFGDDAGGKFGDYKILFEREETVNSPVMDTSDGLWDGGNRVPRLFREREFALEYGLFDNDCVYFDGIKSRSALLTKDGAHGILVSWDGFTTLGVWTPAGKNAPFVCVEPWKGTNDYKDEITSAGVAEFEKKRDVEILPPRGVGKYAMTLELI